MSDSKRHVNLTDSSLVTRLLRLALHETESLLDGVMGAAAKPVNIGSIRGRGVRGACVDAITGEFPAPGIDVAICKGEVGRAGVHGAGSHGPGVVVGVGHLEGGVANARRFDIRENERGGRSEEIVVLAKESLPEGVR